MSSSSVHLPQPQLGFHRSFYAAATHQQSLFLSLPILPSDSTNPRRNAVVSQHNKGPRRDRAVVVKGRKENVWSVDNDKNDAASKGNRERGASSRRRQRGKRAVRKKISKSNGGRAIMVSASMLMVVETLLQTQEPVIKPAWNTFASSVSGIWKGVGAVFSPITAEMEPVDTGNKNENLYDCYTWSHIEAVPSTSTGKTSQIQRKTNWVTLNPYGEIQQHSGESNRTEEQNETENASFSTERIEESGKHCALPTLSSFDLEKSDLMEEDTMGNEPGLVYFEDGSYSRGPIDIPIGEVDDSNYYLSPTFKFEQCLVKGCHMRLRIVHTVEFSNGGSEIQILRVAVYEEQWVSPANMHDESDMEVNPKPFSQRKRTQPSQLAGSWKVFEVGAMPIFGEDLEMEENKTSPFVYLCMETLKTRIFPDNPVNFGEEEIVDIQDATMLWLPGGITAYVDIKKDDILCVGVGWHSNEGINLVMERDYGVDGKLKEVRWKSEVKRRWSDPAPM